MAIVAVNKDGTEVIANRLERCMGEGWRIFPSSLYRIPMEKCDVWGDYDLWGNCVDDDGNAVGWVNISVILSKGTIKKLIGRDLTWEDEPVELE